VGGAIIDHINGDATGDVTRRVPAHAIGHGHQPPLRPLEERVLVPLPGSPHVRMPRDSYFHPVG
jgi:hypothetical protein